MSRGTTRVADTGDAIEDAVALLATRLPDDPASRDLLDEVRDHLLCESEARDGLDPREVAREVTARFGDVLVLGQDWTAELRTAAVRRAAVSVLRLVTVAGFAWLIVLVLSARGPWHGGRPAAVLHDEQVGSVCAAATLGAAVLGVVVVALATRRLTGGLLARVVGLGVAGTTLLSLAGGAVGASAVADLLGRVHHSAPTPMLLPDVLLASLCTLVAAGTALPALVRAVRVLCPARLG